MILHKKNVLKIVTKTLNKQNASKLVKKTHHKQCVKLKKIVQKILNKKSVPKHVKKIQLRKHVFLVVKKNQIKINVRVQICLIKSNVNALLELLEIGMEYVLFKINHGTIKKYLLSEELELLQELLQQLVLLVL